MAETPKISVIITIYNAESYLEESLASIFEQTFQDFELIIVNDGSTDKSKGIIIKYLNNPKVTILENKSNKGIPTSRNRALLVAKGEYIAIHDGDDISLPFRLEKESHFLDIHKDIDFMGGHAIKINAVGEFIGSMCYPPPTTQDAFRVITRYKLNPIIDPSCMYRRKVVLDHGGYSMDPKIKTALDFHLWCRLLTSKHKLANLQEPLIKYRINPSGVTRTETKTMMEITDVIWASFRRKNFSKMTLRPESFMQDCFVEIQKEE